MTPARPSPRPQLPRGAGVHSIELDISATRDELAHTLDDLFATFNLRLIVTSRPVLAAALVTASVTAVALGVVAGRRGRGGRG